MHVKLVARQNNQWVSVPVGPASIPHPVLAYLPASVPRAIEFPLMGKTDEELHRSLSTYISWLRAGKFATALHHERSYPAVR
jgi:hypothetical protein